LGTLKKGNIMAITLNYTCTNKHGPVGPNNGYNVGFTINANDPGLAAMYPNGGAPSTVTSINYSAMDAAAAAGINLGDPLVVTVS
jgi:hypothetical protein